MSNRYDAIDEIVHLALAFYKIKPMLLFYKMTLAKYSIVYS